jgi:hypothetical protein
MRKPIYKVGDTVIVLQVFPSHSKYFKVGQELTITHTSQYGERSNWGYGVGKERLLPEEMIRPITPLDELL